METDSVTSDADGESTRPVSASVTAWRLLLSVLGFAVLMGVALTMHFTADAQSKLQHLLTSTVKAGLAHRDILNLVVAALAFAAWLGQVLATSLVIYVAFLLVEIAIVGPPKNWRVVGYAASVQVTTVLIFLVISLTPVFGAIWGASAPLGQIFILDAANLATWLGPAAPFIVVLLSLASDDFARYWAHRAQHSVPFLWRFHRVHHSVQDMDSLNSYAHPVDAFGNRIGTILLASLIGFNYETVIWLVAFLSMHERLLHTRAPINIGPLGWLLVDNRTHYMHHSNRREDFDCNFSSTFTVWDRLFGTYRRPHPSRLAATGLIEHLPPRNLVQFLSAKLDPRLGTH